MPKKNNAFLYFSGWLLFGCLAGIVILLIRGDINITLNGANRTGSATPVNIQHKDSRQRSFADAVMIAAPAVVSVQTQMTVEVEVPTKNTSKDQLINRFLGKKPVPGLKKQLEIGTGSGVIINEDGYILTNYHVVANKDAIIVRLSDGRRSVAQIIGSDPDTDLAILKIALNKLPTLRIADIEQLRVGDIVLAIGDPFAIGQTVTQGIISATGRTHVSHNTYENFIQTDAAINPGNSGGALINTEGEAVGINSNIFSSSGNFQGISFAIPIDLAQQVAEEIINKGYVVRGWLGVEGQETTPQILRSLELDSNYGILITAVDDGGPGDLAGLKKGDIITRINQQETHSTKDILDLIAAGRPGDVFLIEGLRQRQSFMTKATLGQRPMMSR